MRAMLAISALLAASNAFAADDATVTPQGVGGALQSWSSVPVLDDEHAATGTLNVWGQLQSWITVMDQDESVQADPATYGDPEADPGFTVQRARFGIDGFLPLGDRTCCGQVDYAISVGLGAPYDVLGTPDTDLQIVDAFARWANVYDFGITSLAVGVQRVPFSRDAMMSSARLVFQERAVGTNWLVPGRDAGGVFSQSVIFGDDPAGPQILVRGGLFNGNGNLFGDTDPGLMGSARAEFLMGDAYQTWSHELAPALGVGGAVLFDNELATSTRSTGVDLLARYKWVTLSGELVSSTIQPRNSDIVTPVVLQDTNRFGYHAQLSFFVPFSQGGLELAGRYATLDDDTAFENLGDVQILHAGATWRDVLPAFDLGAGYILRNESPAFANDTVRLWVQVRPSRNL